MLAIFVRREGKSKGLVMYLFIIYLWVDIHQILQVSHFAIYTPTTTTTTLIPYTYKYIYILDDADATTQDDDDDEALDQCQYTTDIYPAHSKYISYTHFQSRTECAIFSYLFFFLPLSLDIRPEYI